MTPSKKAKRLGCDSLAQVITISGVPRSTLADWHESRPFVFAAVCEKVARDKQQVQSDKEDVLVKSPFCQSCGGELVVVKGQGYRGHNDALYCVDCGVKYFTAGG